MSEIQLNRRQALIASGLGTLSLGMPGVVMGSDKVNASGQAVASEKSCIFILLCGGPSHVDTWDMKPDAPLDYRGPYEPISTKVPGMLINEMHTELAKLTDHFTLINSMSHKGAISNHFDAMHNLLSGQSEKRVQEGLQDEKPIPVDEVRVDLRLPEGVVVTSAEFLAPEQAEPSKLAVEVVGDRIKFVVPKFLVYGVVRLR